MKNKITNILFLTTIITVILSVIITYKLNQKELDYALSSNIAIMVYDEGIGEYVQSNNIPIGSYRLNEEKTTCSAGGMISDYNSKVGTLKYNLGTSDECYIYFDECLGAARTIVDLYKGQGTVVGNGKLYLHDSTLTNSAGDGSLRYSGSNPSNYVCFEGEDCTDENNLYRIIGVFGGFSGNVKLIKHTSLGDMQWNSVRNNTWEGSTLEKYLNQTWLPTLGKKAGLIDTATWKVGGMDWDENRTAKNYYDTEKADTVTLNKKIGLMYASEYGFAASKDYWATILFNYNSEDHNNDWLYINNTFQWLISRYSEHSDYAFYIYYNGIVSINRLVTDPSAIRPVFYLTSSTKIKDGDGSFENPFIIET